MSESARKPVIWELIPCQHHHDRDATPGTSTEIFALRNGCPHCRIRITCQQCGHTSKHIVWSSALASERHHQEATCPN